MAMLAGCCLCGSIAYEVDAPAGPIVHCSCRTCRKTHGSAFSSIASVPREKFRWTRGEELLGAFESSPGEFRRFCTRCGSHLFAERLGQAGVMLRLGCLDTPISGPAKAHIWRSQGASWFDPGERVSESAEGLADAPR